MKILFVNKFLYLNGGSETYLFGLSDYLKNMGHDVEFFGMQHPKNIVNNSVNLNVRNMEFKGNLISKFSYPFKIIYSIEAANKISKVIKHFKPDIVHVNNYNFQLTPSILYKVRKLGIPVIQTLHDFQIVCPNHMMYLEHKNIICEECINRRYRNCVKNNCIHNSKVKSVLAAFEGWFYHKLKTYDKYIDLLISPSIFLKKKIVEFGEHDSRIKVLHNFINPSADVYYENKKNYVLYFGRLSIQKGIRTLIKACKNLPELKFIFAGGGELESELEGIENIEFVGFKSGEDLKTLVSKALFSIYPSEWYENCPMSVLESQMYGTPVIGADIGGIPELIDDKVDGLLFKPGNSDDLAEKIKYLYNDINVLHEYSIRCIEKVKKFSIDNYYKELMNIYSMAISKHK